VKARIPLTALGALVLILALAWALRELVRGMIAVPMLEALWWLRLYIQATPAWVYWLLFVILAYLIAIGSLKGPARLPTNASPTEPAARKRIRQLADWITHTDSAFYQHRLNHEITNLAAELLAQNQRITVAQARQQLAEGKFACPKNIQVYLQAGLPIWPEKPPPTWVGWLNSLPGLKKNEAEITQVSQVLDTLESHFGGFYDA
jgi:hypothetical protein